MKKTTSFKANNYLTKMEIVVILLLFITSFCAVKMEMLLAESKYSSSSETLIEKSPHQIPYKLMFKEELALSYFMFMKKNDDKTKQSMLNNVGITPNRIIKHFEK
jgi:hypothetical protein